MAELVAPVRSAVEEDLRDYLGGRVREAGEADGEFGRDLAASVAGFALGGKRLRSVVAWWGWLAGGGADDGADARRALRACAALELVQTWALIHDDVMDGSDLRRGAPSVHAAHAAAHRSHGYAGEERRYAEGMAILAGDLALVWADDMLDEALAGLATREEARAVWRRMRTELIAGQFLDVRAPARRERSEATALRIDRLKTAAYSVERPLHLGAVMAGADHGVVRALRDYGVDIGTAYQLRDDVDSVYADPARTGKDPGEDIRDGKCTLLMSAGLRLAEERGDAEAARLIADPGADPDDATVGAVVAALDRVGARDEVERRRRDLAARGAARLDGLDL
uniref:polyprenyl synthetase family protein n=1 Tax=Nocardiopsis lucentensis TaxID=53441 RepID=UPI000377BE4B